MKKNNLFSFATIWVTLAIATLISSCSSNKSKLLESVPFDADIIGTLNLIELASNSGVKIENSQIVLPAEYTQLKESIPADMLKMGAQWAEAVDLESVVIFGYMKSNDFYGTALIKDADKVRQLLEDNDFTSEMKNGVEIYAKGSNCFAFDDSSDQLWILEKRRVDKLEEFALARKKNNIARYSVLAEALTDDNIANWVFDQTSLGTGLDGQWCVFGVNVKNNAIVAEGKLISTDGEVYRTDALQPVDTDFLRYMPANFICATAIGLNPASGWVKRTEEAISKLGDRSTGRAFAEIAPYLKAIDGTIAAGFGPKNKSALLNPMSPDQWQALIMARMNQSKVNELTELLRSNLPGSTEVSNGVYSFNSREFNVTYGSVDGNFAIGMGLDLKPDKQNSFTSDFTGKPMGFVFQTPMLNTIVDDPKYAFSIKLNMDYNDGVTRLQLNLVGSDKPIIPTLVSTLPEFIDSYKRKARGY